jgi:hypothetical protein
MTKSYKVRSMCHNGSTSIKLFFKTQSNRSIWTWKVDIQLFRLFCLSNKSALNIFELPFIGMIAGLNQFVRIQSASSMNRKISDLSSKGFLFKPRVLSSNFDRFFIIKLYFLIIDAKEFKAKTSDLVNSMGISKLQKLGVEKTIQ